MNGGLCMGKYDNEGITNRINELRCKEALSVNAFAQKCDVGQGNLSKAMRGKLNYSEVVLMKIARAMKVSFEWLTTGCGLCGVDGDKALDDLNTEFQAQRGNTSVVGNHNNVGNNIVSTGISDDILNAFAGVGGLNGDLAKRVLRLMSDNEALKKENEMKDRQIAQLEKDKLFYQSLLEKR